MADYTNKFTMFVEEDISRIIFIDERSSGYDNPVAELVMTNSNVVALANLILKLAGKKGLPLS
jgi:hypothetical protein